MPNQMFASHWMIYVGANMLTAIFMLLFFWRLKYLSENHRMRSVEEIKGSMVYVTPLITTYATIIILVDVSVLDSFPWYHIASALFATALCTNLWVT